MLEYAEAMTKTPADVPEKLFQRLSTSLSREQMVELTAAIALENFSARFNQAFGIGADLPRPPGKEENR